MPQTEWTKKEVIEWHERFGSMERGGLGYQGSDEEHHHFIARPVDSWVFIKVKRDELKMDDERPFSRGQARRWHITPSTPLEISRRSDRRIESSLSLVNAEVLSWFAPSGRDVLGGCWSVGVALGSGWCSPLGCWGAVSNGS